MNNCKEHKIFKFKYAISIDTDKQRIESYRRAQLLTDFKVKFIDKFSSESWEDINRKHFNKEYIAQLDSYLDPYERGLEMIEYNHKIQIFKQYGSLYIGIPLINKEMIKFIDKNIPDYVTTVKKI